MKKHISIAVLQLSLICVLFSCSEETLLVETLKPVEEEVDLTTLRATLKDFKNETMGEEPAVIRSTIVTDEAGELQIVWAENDTIGIFPSSGMQVAFPMASSAGTKNATFDGGGWGLKRSATYSAYYPLIGQFYLDRTNIPMIISNQKQDGNGSYYGNVNFVIADTKGGSDKLTCYRLKGKNNSKFTNANQVAVGDTVLVNAKIQNYNGTCEPTQGYVEESTNPNF